MQIEISEDPITNIAVLSTISIAFTVDRVLEPIQSEKGLLGIVLEERAVETPYSKDYDAIEGEGPARWGEKFDIKNWGLLVAKSEEAAVGGAVIAFDTEGVHMLEDRQDLAVLWDLRVAPEQRGKRIGTKLFEASERWALSRGCRELKVETQNTNVAACRFYQKQGCSLGAINRFAYSELPHEIQLIWRKELSK